jgi:hypothetical protein
VLQILAAPSAQAVMKRVPSGLKKAEKIRPTWWTVAMARPVAASLSLAVLSRLAVSISRPSGLNCVISTSPAWRMGGVTGKAQLR